MLPALEVRSWVIVTMNWRPCFCVYRACSGQSVVHGTASIRSGSIGCLQISHERVSCCIIGSLNRDVLPRAAKQGRDSTRYVVSPGAASLLFSHERCVV